MEIKTTRACFDELVTGKPRADLKGVTGVWELDIEGDKTWSLRVDDGLLSVKEGPTPSPNASVRMPVAEFLKVATGAGHENFLTAVLRGVVRVEGDLKFAQYLELLLPFHEKPLPLPFPERSIAS